MKARHAATSVMLLFAASTVARVSFAFIGIWIAPYLGPKDAGVFFIALAFTNMFAVIPDFGVSPLVVREGARDPSGTPRYFGAGLAFYAVSATVVYGVMLVSARLIGYDGLVLQIVAIMSLVIIGKAGEQVATTVLQLREKLHITACVQFITAIGALFLVYRAMHRGAGVVDITWAILVAGAVSVIALLAIAVMLCRPKFDLATIRYMLPESWPFGAAAMLVTIYLWAGVVILSRICSEADVGQYSAAFRLNTMLYLLPTVLLNQVLAPPMFAWAKTDTVRLGNLYRVLSRHLLMTGLGAGAALFVLREPVIHLVYGSAFAPAAGVLAILCWVLPVRFLATSTSAILTVTDQMRMKNVYQLWVALLLILSSLILIPLYGYMGLAAAVAITETALLASYWVGAGKRFYLLRPFHDLRIVHVSAAAFLMVLVLMALRGHVPLAITIFAGGLAYLAALFAVRYFDQGDYDLVRAIISVRRKRGATETEA